MARIAHWIKPFYGFHWDIMNSIGQEDLKSVVVMLLIPDCSVVYDGTYGITLELSTATLLPYVMCVNIRILGKSTLRLRFRL